MAGRSIFPDGPGFGVRFVPLAPAALAADPVVAFVADDPVSPAGESGRVSQAADPPTDGNPGFLQNVIGRIRVAGQSPGVPPKALLPECDERFKGRRVALLTAQHQQIAPDLFALAPHHVNKSLMGVFAFIIIFKRSSCGP
jgi:hypothetical protein